MLCCAGPASAAPVASRSAVLGAGDVAGLTVGSAPASAWLQLVSRHAGSGARASTTVVKSAGSPKLLIVSHALVARDGVHASAAKRALGAVSPARANGVDARALGVSAGALRKAQRITWRDGPVVGQLVVVGAGQGRRARRAPAGRRARPRAPHPRPVAHGTRCWPASPPAAAAPTRRRRSRPSRWPSPRCPACACRRARRARSPRARSPSSWVLANYGRLTPGVRQAFDKAVRRAFGLSGHPAAGGAKLDAIKAQAVAFVGQQAGVRSDAADRHRPRLPVAAAAAPRRSPSTRAGSYRSSQARRRAASSASAATPRTTVIAHEVFHCLQIQLTGRADALPSLDSDRAWLGEGSASYAGCLFSQDGAAPYKRAYAGYLEQPTTPLGGRTYDAVGFFAHLDQVGAGALGTVKRAIARPVDGGRLPGARQRGRPGHLRLVGLEPLPHSRRCGGAWDVSGACAPARSHAADPTPIVVVGQGPDHADGRGVRGAPLRALHRPVGCRRDHGAPRQRQRARRDQRPRRSAHGRHRLLPRRTARARSTPPSPSAAASRAPRSRSRAARRPRRAVRARARPARRFCAAGNGSANSTPAPPGTLSSPFGHVNRIVEENAKPGTPVDLGLRPARQLAGAGSDDIQGFTTDISYNVGQTVHFKISTIATRYRLDIYRLGWYQGNGARRIDRIEMNGPSNPSAQLHERRRHRPGRLLELGRVGDMADPGRRRLGDLLRPPRRRAGHDRREPRRSSSSATTPRPRTSTTRRRTRPGRPTTTTATTRASTAAARW